MQWRLFVYEEANTNILFGTKYWIRNKQAVNINVEFVTIIFCLQRYSQVAAEIRKFTVTVKKDTILGVVSAINYICVITLT